MNELTANSEIDHLADEGLLQLGWTPKLTDIYQIIYKDGSNLVTRFFAFKFSGDQSDPRYYKNAKFAAVQRAQTYCSKMRYRFVHCQPFLEDLDWREEHISA